MHGEASGDEVFVGGGLRERVAVGVDGNQRAGFDQLLQMIVELATLFAVQAEFADELLVSGLALGLAFSLVVPVNDLASTLLPGMVSLPVSSDVSWHLLSLVDSVLGAVVGASFIYGAGAIYLRARGVEGMGFGDVKLMAMIGAFIGAKLTIFTLFSASIAGSVFGLSTVLAVWLKRTRRRMKRNHESAGEARRRAWESAAIALRRHQMPFGVFLGGMAMVALFYGNSFLHWYWGLL